jgi:hypothetical protein
MKICSVGAELFHADGQTDMAKLIVAFRYFANAPKNYACASCFVQSYRTHDVVGLLVLWFGQRRFLRLCIRNRLYAQYLYA